MFKGQANILADGNMELDNTTNYTASNQAVITKDTTLPYRGTRCLRVTKGDTEGLSAIAVAGSVTAKTYRVTGWARSDTLGNPAIAFQNQVVWTGGADLTEWTYFDITTTTTGGQIRLRNYDRGTVAGSWVEFDDIRIEVID